LSALPKAERNKGQVCVVRDDEGDTQVAWQLLERSVDSEGTVLATS
jgi:hypothetical protein